MSADALLSRLEGVKRTGPGRWRARCPAHASKGGTLSLRELPDGRVLLRCFAECETASVLAAVGLEFSDLFPVERHMRFERGGMKAPWLPADVFEIARHEIAIVNIISCDMHKNRSVSEQDYARLGEACARLERIAEAAYERR